MDGSQGLLEKLARLGINLIPQGAAMAGGAIGGPGGEIAGQVIGSGLEQLLQPLQSPFSGSGMSISQGMPIGQMQEPNRLENVLKTMALQGTMGAAQQALGSKSPNMGDEWLSLFQKLISSVPREEIIKFLEQRSRPQGEM